MLPNNELKDVYLNGMLLQAGFDYSLEPYPLTLLRLLLE